MLKVFVSFAHEDDVHRQALGDHLALLIQDGLVDLWDDRQINPGSEWEPQIEERLASVDVYLLLISEKSIASDWCRKEHGIAVREAAERGARVVPVLLRRVDVQGAEFMRYGTLPRDAKVIADFDESSEFWAEVAAGVRRIATEPQRARSVRVAGAFPRETFRRVAERIQQSLRELDGLDHWDDDRFTDLDAEVEADTMRRRRRWVPFVSPRLERSMLRTIRDTREPLMLLEGEPGSGKSIALRHTARSYVEAALAGDDGPLPVFVDLKNLRPTGPVDAATIRDEVLRAACRDAGPELRAAIEERFDALLRAGRWLILLDSFDEIPEILASVEVDRVVRSYGKAIEAFAHDNHGSRVVVASRLYRGPQALRWPRARILPMSAEKRLEFVRRWFDDLATAKTVVVELSHNDRLREWMKSPLFLGLMCAHRRDRGVVPRTTHDTFESFVRQRLDRDAGRLRELGLSDDDVVRGAERIAHALGTVSGLGLEPERVSLVEHLATQGDSQALRTVESLEILGLARQRELDGRVRFAFFHRRFQEYFATGFALRHPKRVSPRLLLTDARWRETAVTLLQTRSASDVAALLDEAERFLERWVVQWREAGWIEDTAEEPVSGRAAAAPPPVALDWPPLGLHVLGILNSGWDLQSKSRHTRVETHANRIVLAVVQRGIRPDKRLIMEVAGAATYEVMESVLESGFEEGSTWLAEACYSQAARLVRISPELERKMREVLFAQYQSGQLARDPVMIEAHLSRVAGAPTLLPCFRLLRYLEPVDLALTAFLGSVLLMAWSTGNAPNWSLLLGGGALWLAHYVCRLRMPVTSRLEFVARSGTAILLLESFFRVYGGLGPWVPLAFAIGAVYWFAWGYCAKRSAVAGVLLAPRSWLAMPTLPVVLYLRNLSVWSELKGCVGFLLGVGGLASFLGLAGVLLGQSFFGSVLGGWAILVGGMIGIGMLAIPGAVVMAAFNALRDRNVLRSLKRSLSIEDIAMTLADLRGSGRRRKFLRLCIDNPDRLRVGSESIHFLERIIESIEGSVAQGAPGTNAYWRWRYQHHRRDLYHWREHLDDLGKLLLIVRSEAAARSRDGDPTG